jgi:hypothetical protein
VKIALYDKDNSLSRKYMPIQIPRIVKMMEAMATRIKDLNIKIAIKSPITFASTITKTLMALILGLLILS